jgi:hypothetical protein
VDSGEERYRADDGGDCIEAEEAVDGVVGEVGDAPGPGKGEE